MDAWFDATVDSSLRAGTVTHRLETLPHSAPVDVVHCVSGCAALLVALLHSSNRSSTSGAASLRSTPGEGARGGHGRGKAQKGGGRGRGRGKGRGKGRGRLSRPRVAAVQEPGHDADYSSKLMHTRHRDQPREPPFVPIGQNANTTLLRSLCPNQHYPSCFQDVSPPPPCAARGQHEGTASSLS